MAEEIWSESMIQVELSAIGKDLPRFIKDAKGEEVVIVAGQTPIGYLHTFADEDEWYEYRLLNDPRFIRRIAQARKSAKAGRVYSALEVDDIFKDDNLDSTHSRARTNGKRLKRKR